VPENKKKEITDYLLSQQSSGNEIALHLHMHYDMVQSSGVTIRTSPHWGLRSNEGYDVPTTEYSPDEFRLIAGNAKQILADVGFTNVTGYRAGGWFISNDQLKILQSLGFTYDSSGRDRPISGAFKNIPWNLPLGSQPYILFNDPSQKFMEIPNNSGATYEQSISELYKRITDVYTSGILDKPKMLVFVSHPQFAPREFGKIPEVLNKLMKQSYTQDAGPIIFSTMRSIQTQW
jgi:peptidoglycan/xylan/chitin deacetylase (PgdA/CDA1 family)